MISNSSKFKVCIINQTSYLTINLKDLKYISFLYGLGTNINVSRASESFLGGIMFDNLFKIIKLEQTHIVDQLHAHEVKCQCV